MQHMDHVDRFDADPIENQIIPVHAAADSGVFKARHKRKRSDMSRNPSHASRSSCTNEIARSGSLRQYGTIRSRSASARRNDNNHRLWLRKAGISLQRSNTALAGLAVQR